MTGFISGRHTAWGPFDRRRDGSIPGRVHPLPVDDNVAVPFGGVDWCVGIRVQERNPDGDGVFRLVHHLQGEVALVDLDSSELIGGPLCLDASDESPRTDGFGLLVGRGPGRDAVAGGVRFREDVQVNVRRERRRRRRRAVHVQYSHVPAGRRRRPCLDGVRVHLEWMER